MRYTILLCPINPTSLYVALTPMWRRDASMQMDSLDT